MYSHPGCIPHSVRSTEHSLPTAPGPVCVGASTRSLELKKLAAYNRLIAYPKREEPKGFGNHCARPCRNKRSAQPRSYVEPQFDPLPVVTVDPLCVSCISIRWHHASNDYCEDGRILKASTNRKGHEPLPRKRSARARTIEGISFGGVACPPLLDRNSHPR